MKNKKETMEKIKQAALEEFYEKGYAKASLMRARKMLKEKLEGGMTYERKRFI